LEQVEKIEHFINKSTIENLEKLTQELTKAEKSSKQKTQS
jgi:hypothetical protein